MTKEDLKALAEDCVSTRSFELVTREDATALATDYLRLLAQEEARGEVFAACPQCDRWEIRRSQTKPDHQICTQCHAMFTEPAYYQRVPAPPTLEAP
jgi:ribosomal protein L37AE/L43A